MDEIEIRILEPDDLPNKQPNINKDTTFVWGNPQELPVRVLIHQQVIQTVEAISQDSRNEVGGLLLGEAYRFEGDLYIEITNFINAPAKPGQSSATHFNFTPETWAAMLRVKDAEFDALRVIGWFHSHPGHGIFLSKNMDEEIHKQYFPYPWQTAFVYDPKNHTGGFFVWDDDRITPVQGFYEILASGKKNSTVTWKNRKDLGNTGVVVHAPPPPVISPEPTRKGNKLVTALLILVLFGLAVLGTMEYIQFQWLKSISDEQRHLAAQQASISSSARRAELTQAAGFTDLQSGSNRIMTILEATNTPTPTATITATATSTPSSIPTNTSTATPELSFTPTSSTETVVATELPTP